MKYYHFFLISVLLNLPFGCKKASPQQALATNTKSESVYCVNTEELLGFHYLDQKFLKNIDAIKIDSSHSASFEGMVLIPGGEFDMGGDIPNGFENMPATALAQADELPKHKAYVSDFYMDEHEVTIGEFREFVKATGYKTVAEQDLDWNELKKQLPPGTPKPPDNELKASSMVFDYPKTPVSKDNLANWWQMVPGIYWANPSKEAINIEDYLNYPVTHISWYDAMAYAKWVNKRLPTEAEYEYAMRAGKEDEMYPWGNDKVDNTIFRGNFLQGEFPYNNTAADGFERSAPVKSFPANAYGLFDISGNVWEWTNDWYGANYYYLLKKSGTVANNPKGPQQTMEVYEPTATNKVARGGSFLCNDDWCSGYRNARRMRLSPDSSMEHLGFRLVRSAN